MRETVNEEKVTRHDVAVCICHSCDCLVILAHMAIVYSDQLRCINTLWKLGIKFYRDRYCICYGGQGTAYSMVFLQIQLTFPVEPELDLHTSVHVSHWVCSIARKCWTLGWPAETCYEHVTLGIELASAKLIELSKFWVFIDLDKHTVIEHILSISKHEYDVTNVARTLQAAHAHTSLNEKVKQILMLPVIMTSAYESKERCMHDAALGL